MKLDLSLSYKEQNDNKALIITDTSNYNSFGTLLSAGDSFTINTLYQITSVGSSSTFTNAGFVGSPSIGDRFIATTAITLTSGDGAIEATPKHSEIIKAKVDITITKSINESTTYSIDLYSNFGPFTDSSNIIYTIDASYLGGNVGDILDDGIYSFNYNISYSPNSSSEYRVWYTGNNNHNDDSLLFGYATSKDGEIWSKRSSSILGYGVSGDDDDDGIYAPNVIYDSDVSLWKMWYIGKKNTTNTEKFKLMYATSTDGINWTKYSGTAIFSDPVLGGGIFAPSVLKISSNNWLLIYSGVDQPNDGLRYATSTDGITWTSQGVFLSTGGTTEWDHDVLFWGTLVLDNGTLYCFYRGDRKQTDGFGGNSGPSYIGVATVACSSRSEIPSKLTSLVKYPSNPVYSPSTGSDTTWDSGFLNSPLFCMNLDQTIHKDELNNVFMYYSSSNNVSYGSTFPTLPTYNDDRVGLMKGTDYYNLSRVTGLSSNGPGCVITWGNGDRGDGIGHVGGTPSINEGYNDGSFDQYDVQIGTVIYYDTNYIDADELDQSLLVDGNIKTNVYDKLRQIPTSYECSDCNIEDVIKEADFAAAYLSAIEKSAYIGKEDELINMLSTLKFIVNNNSCINC